ncbi:MAG: F0F1 ATP synthase subunit delta [Actinomycetota bacterium]|nr:F0F1 ATP synthase subunit delta [Actinomycetota bacterium]
MLGASRTSLAQARARLTGLGSTGPGGGSAADLGALSEDLFGVVGLLGRELPLRRTLADPFVPPQAKTALLEGLLGARITPASLSFLSELVTSRWSRPRDLTEAIETLAALAAFAEALADGTLDDVEDELFRFGRIVEREAALRDTLADPAQTEAGKRSLLAALLDGKVRPVSLRVITAAAVSGLRGRSLTEALDAFAKLAADLRERLNARVTAAVPLDEAQTARLADELSRLYGKAIGVRLEVDPSILGGLVIRVGDEVLDASITRRLDIARRGLTEHL